jgi:hypothetical protein
MLSPADRATYRRDGFIGSATNFSGKERRFLLFQYRAADAWPLLGFADGIDKFDELLLAGEPTLAPRPGSGPIAVAAGGIPRLDLREPAHQQRQAVL